MHKSNNSRTVKSTEMYDGLKFQEKYFTYGSAKKFAPGKLLASCVISNEESRTASRSKCIKVITQEPLKVQRCMMA